MSESTGTPEPGGEDAAPPPSEDDRRQKAAEANRKRTEEAWLRNKQRWIQDNFPGKRKAG